MTEQFNRRNKSNEMGINLMRTFHKRRLLLSMVMIVVMACALLVRLWYLMFFQADHFGERAKEVQERERTIKAELVTKSRRIINL